EGCGMTSLHLSRDIAPDLLEPPAVVLFIDQREISLLLGGGPVRARLAKQEGVFNVIFYDRIGLVGLAQKRRAVAADFRRDVGDLLPDDRSQGVKADFLALQQDLCVNRLHEVTAELPARSAHVSNHHAETTARLKEPEAVLPHFAELRHEDL